jgi:hypothetical protein
MKATSQHPFRKTITGGDPHAEERNTYYFLTPARYMVPGKIQELNQWVPVVLEEQT